MSDTFFMDVFQYFFLLPAVTTLAVQALSFIFTNLPMAVASLPLTIRFLFQAAEKHVTQYTRQLRIVGLLLWALMGCMIQGLEDPELLEQISGLALDRGAKECMSLLAECLQAAIGIQQKVNAMIYLLQQQGAVYKCSYKLNVVLVYLFMP